MESVFVKLPCCPDLVTASLPFADTRYLYYIPDLHQNSKFPVSFVHLLLYFMHDIHYTYFQRQVVEVLTIWAHNINMQCLSFC